MSENSEAQSFADLGRILVIIPTYNEQENITRIVTRLRTAVPEAHVLIVDDNSPDGTGNSPPATNLALSPETAVTVGSARMRATPLRS